jgi:hypothetical protein
MEWKFGWLVNAVTGNWTLPENALTERRTGSSKLRVNRTI